MASPLELLHGFMYALVLSGSCAQYELGAHGSINHPLAPSKHDVDLRIRHSWNVEADHNPGTKKDGNETSPYNLYYPSIVGLGNPSENEEFFFFGRLM